MLGDISYIIEPAIAEPAVNALPTGADIKSGQITIHTENNKMTIHQKEQAGEIHWKEFDLGKNAEIKFVQPDGNSVTLNKVNSATASQLYGKISSTGHVFVINPNGVIFGDSLDTVDLGGLLVGGINMHMTLDEIRSGTIGMGEDAWSFRIKNLPNTVSLQKGVGLLENADDVKIDIATAMVIEVSDWEDEAVKIYEEMLRRPDLTQDEREIIDTKAAPWYQGMVPGLHVMPLMQQGSGSTLVRWAPQTYFSPHKHYGGEEIFVVDGVFEDEHGRYPTGSWIRSPHMSLHQPFSKEGCTIFVKTGHLLV
jgi:filamentous hemagglutinin family protein